MAETVTAVTLKHLVNRLLTDTELLAERSGKSHSRDLLEQEVLERRIQRHKEDIVQCVINNKDSGMLDNIQYNA